jgi:hypothetical protein
MSHDLRSEPCAVNFYQIKVDHVSAEVGRADGMSINNPDAIIQVKP